MSGYSVYIFTLLELFLINVHAFPLFLLQNSDANQNVSKEGTDAKMELLECLLRTHD